jgi:altronate hydrolase
MLDLISRLDGLIQIDPRDTVAVAVRPIAPRALVRVGGREIRALTQIPEGHKIALQPIACGAQVVKYGWPIGRARLDIPAGSHVHTHNLATCLEGIETYKYVPRSAPPPRPASGQTFLGYPRTDGRVGTRNEIWILPTVGCVARTVERIARTANERFAGRVDGVYAFAHPLGCSQLGDDLARTRKILAALAAHPNAGGVLLVGLGCESNQLDQLRAEVPAIDPHRVRSFNAQKVEDETEEGLAAVGALVEIAERVRRQPCPLSGLTIGLKCGGSDGFSGLIANPLVGRIADRIAEAGGTPILTEIPEIFGAEHLVMERAINTTVFEGIVAIVNDFKQYFLDHHHPIYENPSPGNIAGGITTLEEKSLGAVQKAGRTCVTHVLRYGERTNRPGLALLEAPGNDAISSTALVAAGANILLFTTGRGTPLGFPAPTIKIASNSALAKAKPSWIDYDAGTLATGKHLDTAADELMTIILKIASGTPALNERNDERAIALWKGGVTL